MEKRILSLPDVLKVLELLTDTYPEASCELAYGTPYQLLTAVMLSAQTTDKRVNQVTEELFEKYPDAEAVCGADPGELQRILRPIGMYRTKTDNLLKLSRMLTEEFGGVVPEDQALLETLPGIGRKSANVVMAEAFGHQRIAVDTHVFRVSNRIGLVSEKNVLAAEKALMNVLPKDRWTASHHLLIWHGRRICKARSPGCEDCPLEGICVKAGVEMRGNTDGK